MQTRNRELWAAFIAVLLITIFYLLLSIISDGFPTASSPVAHTMAIVGFILMLMTEVLYSGRKRSRRAHLGRMSSWLDFHTFTGIVGPYLVVLHGAWKFNGLAGVVVHFLGDPCLVHGEHTAHSLDDTLSCRAMSCLCFFHACYAPVEAALSEAPRAFLQAEEPPRNRPIRLLAFDIFHPPRTSPVFAP